MSVGQSFLEINGLGKDYFLPDGSAVSALSLDSFKADRGEAVAVVGPSGSGKSTLLHLLAALYRPTRGRILWEGEEGLFSRNARAERWRAGFVGYVFQNLNLLPDFSALENILIAGEVAGAAPHEVRNRAASLLSRLGLSGKMHVRPGRMSLGERQRAAVARAVVHRPPLVLADEPTASLDAANAQNVLDLLLELCAESGSLLFVATHDEAVKRRFERLLPLKKNGDETR